MKVALDLHDFSIVNNRLDLLLKLKEHFPKFKVSMFTVPVDETLNWGIHVLRNDLLEEIKKHLDWIQIIPHGIRHYSSWEIRRINYRQMEILLSTVEEVFNREGLPFENGFCAPHWRWSRDAVKVLDDYGWWGAVDRDMEMPSTKRFYKYNYLLNEPFWESKEKVLKLHGHVYGTRNDIGKCFDNLLKLPKDTEWHYVTDFLEDL